VRLFLHQAFQISRAGRGDTALYVPDGNYMLDYKGWCSLLIYAQNEAGQPFDQFAVGNYGIEDKEGTFRDAEDGILSGNLVEHGGVDSVVRCSAQIKRRRHYNGKLLGYCRRIAKRRRKFTMCLLKKGCQNDWMQRGNIGATGCRCRMHKIDKIRPKI
jgi:hypothetical protein